MTRISAPVGKAAKNLPADVKLVQQLLNRARTGGQLLLQIDGVCGPRTIGAIEEYQARVVRLAKPDGVVAPNGPTYAALAGLAGHPHVHKKADLPPPPPTSKSAKTLTSSDSIAWGAKVSPEFKKKVIKICQTLDVSPDFLMAAMAFESGESFSPSIKNAAGSGAVGLIQFMPSTAKALGTSTDALAGMSAEAQLDYVEKYFTPNKGKLTTLDDVYMAILYPAAIGTGSDHVLFKEKTKVYEQNAGLDKNKDGKITVGEAAGAVNAKLRKGLLAGYAG